MTRLALAEQAGVSRQAVEELERGYPVPSDIAAAICRNLDLPLPALDSNPVIRLALLVRQRRGQARLSRAQVAHKAGLTNQVLRALETASLWPDSRVCMALLSVQALGLQESDVAAFLTLPDEGTASEVPPTAQRPRSAAAAPHETAEPSAPPRRSRGRPAGARSAPPPGGPPGNQVVATFLIRFYASGKVSLEMRPTCRRPRQKIVVEEDPRDGAHELRVPPAR